MNKISKIAVVGNIAGGKTKLSRRMAEIYNLPLTHIDSLQFLPGMKIRPLEETRSALAKVTLQEKWIIDGFGPLDLIEKRFQAADLVVFIDLPVWRHFWWLTKRQVQNLWSRRKELPEGCSELTWDHTVKLYKTLWQIHTKMLPELRRIFARENLRNKVHTIHTVNEWNLLFRTIPS